MKILLLIVCISLGLGYAFVVSAYKGAFSRNKPDKQIERYFELGLFLVLIGIVSFALLSYRAGLRDSKKENKKEQAFVIQKKLNSYKAEILRMEEGDIFIIEEDKLLPPTSEEAGKPSLSDVKKM